MYFAKFPVATTYIFPQVNSVTGGQLLSEYNLRCRESVATNSSVEYAIGPSYVHSMRDFGIDNSVTGTSTLVINPGIGLVNGHFIDSKVPIEFDLLEINANLPSGEIPLRGALTVGLKAFYSTEATMAGTLLTERDENDNILDYFEGIKVVILPSSDFKLPEDVPQDQNRVTAHLKLADFRFSNGVISNITNNSKKVQILGEDRLAEIRQSLGGEYVTKTGLINQYLYTMSGNGTWCTSNEALMKWDLNATPIPNGETNVNEAQFVIDSDNVDLVVPHKQIDGLVDENNNPMIIPDKKIRIPVASYNKDTPGIVNSEYTRYIKSAVNKLNDIYRSASGKQVWYIDVLNSINDLPKIQDSWRAGDYILVRLDNTVGDTSVLTQAPSTMYVVLPGAVTAVGNASDTKGTGTELSVVTSIDTPPTTGSGEGGFDTLINLSSWRGEAGVDYFTYNQIDENNAIIATKYYIVTNVGSSSYSDTIYLTGGISLAQTDLIGGFYNITGDEYPDYGYVNLDEDGHLRLVDYALLRSGELAYQLGENFVCPSGITSEEIQVNLDEYVNNRITFPNATQVANKPNHPEVIDLTITLPKEELATSIFIENIDSRFSSSVYLHILGEADNKTTIYINNCAKLRIDENISGHPNIVLNSVNLYYDAAILDEVTITDSLRLWYEKYTDEDVDLIVDGLSVYTTFTPTSNIAEIDFLNNNRTDTHVKYSLRGIKFNQYGEIVGVAIYLGASISVQDLQTLDNITVYLGKFDFTDGYGFNLPKTRLSKQIKIIGLYTTAYVSGGNYYMTEMNFSILTPYNDPDPIDAAHAYVEGSIGLKLTVFEIQNENIIADGIDITDYTVTNCWQPDTYNVYEGY